MNGPAPTGDALEAQPPSGGVPSEQAHRLRWVAREAARPPRGLASEAARQALDLLLDPPLCPVQAGRQAGREGGLPEQQPLVAPLGRLPGIFIWLVAAQEVELARAALDRVG